MPRWAIWRGMITSTPLAPRHGALIVLFALLALTPVVFWAGSIEAFESTKSLLLLLGGLLLAWLGLVASRPGENRLPRDPLTTAVVAGLVVAALATLTSISPLTSLLGALESHAGLLTAAAVGAVYLAARTCIQSKAQVGTLVAGLVVGSALAAGYGLVQALHLDPVSWQGRSDFAGWFRPGGSEGHAMRLGALLVAVLPLLFWLGGQGGRTVTALLVALFLAVLAVLLARGAWLGAAAAGCVGLALVGRRPEWLTWPRLGLGLATVAVVLALSGVLGPLLSRLAGLGASQARLYVFQSAWGLFLERPWLGWGPDTFHFVFGRHRLAEYWALEWGRTPLRAHNEFLHILATQGALGGVAFLGLLAAVAWAGWLAWQRAPGQRGLVAALLASATAYQVQLLTGFSTVTGGVLFAVVCALLSRLSDGPLDEQAPFPLGRVLLWAAAGLGWLILAGNLVAFMGRAVAFVDLAILLALAVPPVLATWAYPPAAGASEEMAAWQGWLRPVPLLGLGLAAGLAWVLVVRPAVAWGLSQADMPGAARWCPERAEVWSHAGRAAAQARLRATGAERLRCLKRAHRAVEQWCQLCPADPEAHNQRARALLELARAGEAGLSDVLGAYDDALKRDARNTVLLRDAGRAALSLGNADKAETYLKRAAEAGPPHPSVTSELAALALLRRDLARAMALFLQAIEEKWGDDLEGRSRALGLGALISLELNDYSCALFLARQAAPHRPDWAALRVIEGTALERLGREEEAHAAYRKALALDPAHPLALAGVRRLVARREPDFPLKP